MRATRQKIRRTILIVSLLAFPVTLYYFSPYLVIRGSFAGIVTGSLLVFAGQFLTAFLFGRAFCGWICPAGSLQELVGEVNPRSVNKPVVNAIKYILWVPWLATIVLGFIKAGGINKVDFTYMTQHGISAADPGGYIMYAFITLLFLGGALLFGRRAVCHGICWMAPFMILSSKAKNLLRTPSLHLEAAPDACVNCGLCNRKCTMGLDVANMVLQEKMDSNECILCGECVDVCNKQAIRYAFIRSKK
jgi:polyferredoxin